MFATAVRLQRRTMGPSLPRASFLVPYPVCQAHLHNRRQIRIFSSETRVLKQQNANHPPPDKSAKPRPAPASMEARSETAKKSGDTGAADTTSQQSSLLSEAIVSRKQQRKVDWAIMKEMVKYLWPKVQTAIPPFSVCRCLD